MPSVDPTLAGARLDHVMIMVRDLRTASDDYRKLGFRVRSGGRHLGGTENTVIPFGIDMPYLELVGIYQPGGEPIRDNEEFLEKGEGAMYVGLTVKSAAAVAECLRELGVDVPAPSSGTINVEGVDRTPPSLWQNVVIPHGSSPRAEPLFFIESSGGFRASLAAQDPELLRRFDEERRIPHPNGAVTLATAWFAVEVLDAAVARYEGWGFRRARELRIEPLQARAIELALGRGSILIMESVASVGPIRKLLDLHGFGIEVPGVSIEVQSVDKALDSMAPDTSARLQRSSGRWGPNVVIPPNLTHGVWIELFEQGVTGG